MIDLNINITALDEGDIELLKTYVSDEESFVYSIINLIYEIINFYRGKDNIIKVLKLSKMTSKNPSSR